LEEEKTKAEEEGDGDGSGGGSSSGRGADGLVSLLQTLVPAGVDGDPPAVESLSAALEGYVARLEGETASLVARGSELEAAVSVARERAGVELTLQLVETLECESAVLAQGTQAMHRFIELAQAMSPQPPTQPPTSLEQPEQRNTNSDESRVPSTPGAMPLGGEPPAACPAEL